jgi:hypothetical protein
MCRAAHPTYATPNVESHRQRLGYDADDVVTASQPGEFSRIRHEAEGGKVADALSE